MMWAHFGVSVLTTATNSPGAEPTGWSRIVTNRCHTSGNFEMRRVSGDSRAWNSRGAHVRTKKAGK
ncbi:hypothetical protein ACU4GI_43255 [Cupriavidus basilensis]